MRLSATVLLLALISACAGEKPASDGVDTGTGGPGPGDDADGDGKIGDDDCDNSDATTYVGADELCDGVDNDCDGVVDNGANDGNQYYADNDGDGYGDGPPTTACEQPEGMVTDSSDCDDADDRVHPGAIERCNDADDDCDGSVDEDVSNQTWYADTDGDGYGDPNTAQDACDKPAGAWVLDDSDCDDTNGDIHPTADEVCNDIDDDCNGLVDDGLPVETWYPDADGDTYGDPTGAVETCEEPAGDWVSDNTDCDDTDSAIHPLADEICDGVDNDCDTSIDEDAIDATYSYEDADGDSFGDPATYDLRCDGVSNGRDCDDARSREPQVADVGSTSASPDGSATNAWPTIQEAMDAALECVLVRKGTYTENLDFNGKNILVESENGSRATVIDGSAASAPVVTFDSGETSGAELLGFTLIGGSGYSVETTTTRSCDSSSTCTDHYTSICGGGIYIDGSEPTLVDLNIRGNLVAIPADYISGTDYYYYFGFGGGICLQNATIMTEGVDVYENYAESGGGIYVDATASLSYNTGGVVGNTAVSGAGFYVDGGTAYLTNALLSFNDATTTGGGFMGIDATARLINVTAGKNDSPTGGGLYASGTTAMTVMNTIVSGSDTGAGVLVDSTATYLGSYDDVYGNTDGNYSGITDPTGTMRNRSVDPQYTNVTDDSNFLNDEWTLKATSTLLDSGNPAAAYDDVDGSDNEVGAYGGPNGGW
jgi:hypothetical protein